MLVDFGKELIADKSLNFKHVPYYIRWVMATGPGLND